ncbi:MAG: ChbG/HpnK family deacetylase [bacterium]|nr:ChbG/HpnK family deacetylase [bacterium]
MIKPFAFIFFLVFAAVSSYAADGPIRLLVRADDIGATHDVNTACIQAYTDGVARSIEALVPAPWFNLAAKMLNEHPEIDVGVHLCLTSEWENLKWRPVTPATTFVDAMGNFLPMTSQRPDFPPNTGFIQANPDPDEVERELRAQIEIAKKAIHNVTHLSAHMGTATCMPELKEITGRLAEEYDLPIELPVQLSRFPSWSGADKTPGEKTAALVNALETIGPGTYLIVEHPGLDTPEMQDIGHKGYENVAADRAGVLFAYCSPEVKSVIERRGIQLVSYADLLRKD